MRLALHSSIDTGSAKFRIIAVERKLDIRQCGIAQPTKLKSLNLRMGCCIVLVLVLFSAATGLASAQGSAASAMEARQILQQTEEATFGLPEDCNLLTEIAVAEAKAGDVEGAIQTAAGIRDDECSRYAFEDFNAVLGQVQRTLQIAAQVRDDRAKTYTLLAIVESQAEAGHVQIARKAALEIPDGTEWKATAFATVARAQVKAGDRADALQTLNHALQAAGLLRGDLPRASALEDIAAAQAESGDVAGALRTFKQVPEGKRDPTVFYSNLVRQLVKAGDVKEALQIAAEIADGSVSVDDSAWREIAMAQAKSGEMQGALRSAENIRSETEKVKALNAIAQAQAKSRRHCAEANKTFQRALQAAALIQNPTDRWDSLREIAEAQAETGNHRGAVQATDDILNETTRAQALRAIAGAQAKMGIIQGAVQTAGNIRVDSVKEAALGDIALVQYKTGDVQGAMGTVSGLSNGAKATALSSVASEQLKVGHLAVAAKTIEQILQHAAGIHSDREKANALVCIVLPVAEAQVKAGDRIGAIHTLEQTRRVAAHIRSNLEKARVLSMIASAQVKRGDISGAGETVEQARQTAALIQPATKSNWILARLVINQAEAGGIQGALQTLAMMMARQAEAGIHYENVEGAALKAIARAQAKSGDVQGARRLADRQSSRFLKANTLLGMAEGTLEQRDAAQSQIAQLSK